MIKTYRGILADGGQDKINLKTNKGDIGYRIVKFQTMTKQPFAGDAAEHTCKIYKVAQTTIDGVVDFSDNTLLGVAIINNYTNGYSDPSIPVVIFDKEIFNQNIYITGIDTQGSQPVNYYIELEQVKLNDNESTMATLQSLRTIASK